MIRRRGLVNFFWRCHQMVMCIEAFVSSSGADAAGDVSQSSCRDSATWKSLYDRERIRAEAAEGRCEELRLQEVEERSRANSLKAIFESNREKLSAARAEVREVRRTAKQSLALKQEVVRPGRLLAEAGARKRSTVVSPRMENTGLKTAMKVLKGRGARGGERQASFEQVVRAQEREEAAGVVEARHSWPRPAFEEVEERLEVAEDACSCCVANGSHQDHRDQKRRIVRRGCDCPGSPVAAVSRHRIRVWTHVLHERVHAALAPRPGAFAGNAGQRAGCCPCSSRFGTRSSRTGVCAMPMHPGPKGGPKVAPGSGHRSAVTRSSPSRSAEVAAKLFADAPMSATATAPARSWRACGPSSSCAVAGRIVGATSGLRRPQLEGWADERVDRGDLLPEHGSTALLPAAFEATQAAPETAIAVCGSAEASESVAGRQAAALNHRVFVDHGQQFRGKGYQGPRPTGGSPASVPTAWTAVMYTVRSRGAASTFCAGLMPARRTAICRPGCREPGEAAEIRSAAVRSRARLHGRAVLRRSRSGPHRPRLLPLSAPKLITSDTAAPKTLDELRPLTLPRIHAPGRRRRCATRSMRRAAASRPPHGARAATPRPCPARPWSRAAASAGRVGTTSGRHDRHDRSRRRTSGPLRKDWKRTLNR